MFIDDETAAADEHLACVLARIEGAVLDFHRCRFQAAAEHEIGGGFRVEIAIPRFDCLRKGVDFGVHSGCKLLDGVCLHQLATLLSIFDVGGKLARGVVYPIDNRLVEDEPNRLARDACFGNGVCNAVMRELFVDKATAFEIGPDAL